MNNKIYKDRLKRNLIKINEFKRRLLKVQHHSLLDKYDFLGLFELQFKLSKLTRNSSITRAKNLCLITGRARGVYKHFRVSRFILKEFIATKIIHGLIKSSW